MKRSLFLAALVAAPLVATAQTKPETQPSQKAATPEPAKTPPAAPPVQVYGTVNVNTQWTRSIGATVGTLPQQATAATRDVSPRLAVSTDSSNVGVRAQLQVHEVLGKAIVQCETTAAIDGIGASGICNRNSQIGLSGKWGTLFYGNWDTPFKSVWYGTKADDPFGNTDVFDRAALMGVAPFNVKSSAWKAATGDVISGFNLRAQNSVAYWTPKVMGLSAKVQYGANEFKNASGSVSPKLWSANVVYDNGPVSLVAAYENHEWGYGLQGFNNIPTTGTASTTRTFGSTVVNSATAHTEDYAWRVGAGYQLDTGLGATTPSFIFEQVKFMQPLAPTGAIKDYNHYAWSAAIKHRAGAHEFRFRYDMANAGGCTLAGGAACNTADYDSKMLTAGYAYYLGAPTQIYVTWAQIMNNKNAQYTFATAGAAAVSAGASNGNPLGTTKAGQDPQALCVGMRHAF